MSTHDNSNKSAPAPIEDLNLNLEDNNDATEAKEWSACRLPYHLSRYVKPYLSTRKH